MAGRPGIQHPGARIEEADHAFRDHTCGVEDLISLYALEEYRRIEILIVRSQVERIVEIGYEAAEEGPVLIVDDPVAVVVLEFKVPGSGAGGLGSVFLHILRILEDPFHLPAIEGLDSVAHGRIGDVVAFTEVCVGTCFDVGDPGSQSRYLVGNNADQSARVPSEVSGP